MNDIVNDAIHFAINRYLILNNCVPYDAVVEASRSESNSDLWAPALVSQLAGDHNYFREKDLLNADPAKHRPQFDREMRAFQERSTIIASIAGMLCERWNQHDYAPWTSDESYQAAVKFAETMVARLA